MSASIGISTLRGREAADLLEEADRFLYEAKRAHPAAASVHFNPHKRAKAASRRRGARIATL
jgi:hypothetical protein